MGAAGPVLGGWLIDGVGWRAIFLINLPPAIGAILLALIFVRDTRPERGFPALDVSGGLLATAGLGAITWGLTIGAGPGGWTMMAVVLAAAGTVLMLGFLAVEKAKGERAMMPLALFGSASFIGLTIFTWLLYGALGALMVLVPYVLIQAGGYSGTAAGAALVPFAVVLTVTSPMMGGIAGRMGPRLPLAVGGLAVAFGFLLLLRLNAAANYWTGIFPGILVISIGMSGAVAPLTTAVLSSVDSHHTGSASGLQQRGGARCRHGRHGSAGRGVGRARRRPDRRLRPCRHRLCHCRPGRVGQRLFPDPDRRREGVALRRIRQSRAPSAQRRPAATETAETAPTETGAHLRSGFHPASASRAASAES